MRISVRWAIVFALLIQPFSAGASEISSDITKMKLEKSITGDISPKSVRASKTGFVSAHNMMYRHSVTIYDAQSLELKATVADSVDLSKYGYSKYSGEYKGAPVEGAFSPDGKYLYLSKDGFSTVIRYREIYMQLSTYEKQNDPFNYKNSFIEDLDNIIDNQTEKHLQKLGLFKFIKNPSNEIIFKELKQRKKSKKYISKQRLQEIMNTNENFCNKIKYLLNN